jgi:hypothetical protein
MGPILGSLCDIYGRKKFCILYCVCIITHISLRITGSRALAWPAQVITGVCSCLLDFAFESWLNFEASSLPDFRNNTEDGKAMKNSYLREIFSKLVSVDCFCSIVLSGIATILYVKFDIFYPFYACMAFAFVGAVLIMFLWRENDVNAVKKKKDENSKDKIHDGKGFFNKINLAWNTLIKDRALFSIGGIESLFKVCINLFLFIWVPLLEETVGGYINPGAIFACFMLARLIGAECLEV